MVVETQSDDETPRTRLEELWQDYQGTLPRLDAARDEHTEAYRLSQEAYRRWINAGGEHKEEKDYGKP